MAVQDCSRLLARPLTRLHVWPLTQAWVLLVVAAAVSFYLLWLTVSDDWVRSDVRDNEDVVGDPDRQRLSSSSSAKVNRRRKFRRSADAPQPRRNLAVYYDENNVPGEFERWSSSAERTCSGHLIGYGHEFALLKGVLVDRTRCESQRLGGESIEAVLNQDESVEYVNVRDGCFQLPCVDLRPYSFSYENKHLNSWMNALQAGRDTAGVKAYQINEFTIAVQRYEYVNLYHTMTDWYNTFLVMQFFRRSPSETNILIVDGHPYGSLDPVWPQLFNSTFRLSALPSKTRFRRMAWNIAGYSSPMKIFMSPYPPLFEEFRSFFLSSFGVTGDRRVNCDRQSVLFIWRRDYVAHPRNPSGFVLRKIDNEQKLMEHVRKKIVDVDVRGVQVDTLPMRDQLQLVVDADILVGVHGAGLTHAMFLPRGAGLIELAPNVMWAGNEHFETIASWHHLVYQRWTNNDVMLDNEMRGLFFVPPQVVTASIRKIRKRMCANFNDTL